MDVDRFKIQPNVPVTLADWATTNGGEFEGGKSEGEKVLGELAVRLAELQMLLYAQHEHRVLLVLQGMDTSGKDGTIRKVFREVGPIGVDVANFKKPNDEEMSRDYLWRVHQHTPRIGHVMVFNRSHYEDVLIARVRELVPHDRIERRYGHLNDFERMLADEGVTIRKCFLHISKETQRERLQSRLDNPHKQWKFHHGDIEERKLWDDYQDAYELALSRTATEWAPWYVIPSDNKWYRNLAVARLLVDTLEGLDMSWPETEGDLDNLKIK
jgi:PPK2 family polyphosphate:nucleotide phosphotransferase